MTKFYPGSDAFKSQIEKRWQKLQSENQVKSWWAPVWRGLIIGGKHYRVMKTALWLYLYLIVHADREIGFLFRTIGKIASDMKVSERTVKRWLRILRRSDYIITESTGRSLKIFIQRWKSIKLPKKPP